MSEVEQKCHFNLEMPVGFSQNKDIQSRSDNTSREAVSVYANL